MNRLNRSESAIFVSLICSLLPEDLQSELILSSLQLALCRVSAVKCLPVHNHSANYVFWPFGIIVPLSSAEAGSRGRGQCCIFTLLHTSRLNKTESAIFVTLMCSLLPEDHSDLT